jgi:DNA-binding FrmR family transcriptional regulator
MEERRHAHRDERQKKLLRDRLGRIEGQVRGLSRMVESDLYCEDILNQLASVKAALNGVAMILFEDHAQHCIVPSLPASSTEPVQELTRLVKRLIG